MVPIPNPTRHLSLVTGNWESGSQPSSPDSKSPPLLLHRLGLPTKRPSRVSRYTPLWVQGALEPALAWVGQQVARYWPCFSHSALAVWAQHPQEVTGEAFTIRLPPHMVLGLQGPLPGPTRAVVPKFICTLESFRGGSLKKSNGPHPGPITAQPECGTQVSVLLEAPHVIKRP